MVMLEISIYKKKVKSENSSALKRENRESETQLMFLD